MTGTPEYSWEKFYEAVRILASGRENLRRRLSDAYVGNLSSLVAARMPWEDLSERFDKLREKLTPEISESSLDKPTSGEDDLRDLALEIVSIYDAVCARYVRG